MWPFSSTPRPLWTRKEPAFANSSPENPSTNLADPSSWLYEGLGAGRMTHAGVRVSEETAVRSTVAFRCIALLSGIIGSLRLKIYEDTDKGRRTATDHRLYPLLHDAPNDRMSSFIWRELIGAHLLTNGNHYSRLVYDGAARVIGIEPHKPQATQIFIRGSYPNIHLVYRFTYPDGSYIDADQEDVIHVPGLGFDGIRGLSPIQNVGRQAIGLSLSLEEFAGRVHDQGAHPSGIVSMKKPLQPEGMRRMRAEFDEAYSGVRNAGKTIILDNDMTWTAMQLSPEDTQALEERKFQVNDICRIFGVPPHLVGETDRSTSWGTGIEQQTLAFLIFSANPFLDRIQAELNRKLFTGRFYCEFDRDTINAIDSKTRAELFSSGIQNAYLTPNEVRRRLNLPDAEGGDRLFIQAATVPIEQAGQQQGGAGNGAPEPAEPPSPDPSPEAA
jgi:HK97 family phage portal protein